MLRNLRRIRRERELSQAQLADLTGLRQQYLSYLECGLRPSDPSHITVLAQALSVDEAALSAQTISVDQSGTVAVGRRRLRVHQRECLA